MIRSATNNRMPPSAASGTRFRSPVPNASSASTIAAAARPDYLRLAAGLSDDARARRARIHRKRAEDAGEDAAGARAEEIAVDIGGLVGIGGEGSRGRRRLHHHHDRDHEGERHQPHPLLGRDDQAASASASVAGTVPTTLTPLALEAQPRSPPASRRQGRSARPEFWR